MVDPRFRDCAEWQRQKAEGAQRGEALLAEMGDRTVTIDRIAAAIDDEGDVIAEVAASLPPVLAEDLDRLQRSVPLSSDGSHCALAHALASWTFRAAPSAERMERASSHVRRLPDWARDVFHEACAERFRRLEHERKDAWLKVMSAPPRLPQRAAASPGRAIEVSRSNAVWEIVDPFELWEEHGAAIELVASFSPLSVLQHIDPDRWFAAVADWRDGRFVFAAFFGSHTLYDRETLLRWLGAAPAVFDGKDAWTGSTAAIVLAGDIVDHGSRLATAVASPFGGEVDAVRNAALARLSDEELPAFFDAAWRVLLDRSDGVFIAVAMLCRLSEPGPTRNHRYHVDVIPIARTSLVHALSGAELGYRRLRELLLKRRASRYGDSRAAHASVLVAISTALALAGPIADDDFFQWFAESLDEKLEWRWFASTEAFSHLLERAAAVLMTLPSGLPRVEALYVQLEPGRRRAEFGRTYAEADADLPSLLVLALLTLMVVRTHHLGRNADAIAAAARAYRGALRLSLVSSPAFDGTLNKDAVLTETIVTWARVDVASLVESIRPTLCAPPHAAATAAALLKIVPCTLVEEAIAPVYPTLAALADRAEAWAHASDLPVDKASANALRRFISAS
jgi:hypothetical protein